MAIKVPDVGELDLLNRLRNDFNVNNLTLRLFQNDYTPANGDTVLDYTEADFSGYVTENLGDFTLPFPSGTKALTTSSTRVFAHDGGATANDIYGYFVTDAAGTTLLWAERLAGVPIVMDSLGDTLPITPTLTLASES